MLMLSSASECLQMATWKDAKLNEAKEILAYELTNMVHGEEEAKKAQEASKALFAGGGDSANVPSVALKEEDFRDGKVDILQVLVSAGLCATRSEARRNVQQGGVTVADEKVTDVATAYDKEFFAGDGVMVRRGKKAFKKVTL